MTQTVKIEERTRELAWLPLSKEILESLDLSIGDWVLIELADQEITIEKIETEQITVEIGTELLERTLTFRDLEGYYTLEEALSNLVRKGLAYLYRERGEENKAEEIEKSWLVQIHSSG
ncbi:hypothetical protein AKJ37_01055 [candidate division MSBL1 archaeon SCGC-AAA259I09]|uniref:Uncharacterized protein n=2 Tax=candidate division MSBL1 TaxID=215777 RepID=A0A133UPR1_9EURY|nr:hypothetical protein AKJ38_03685 [candidate division MSBL1 archaeon SCGC-AAA259I14]KXA98207.1 hypothetical protein AKJ37_01055 [candidate division MSBL1 archaeon SCGC-AAA259I09]